LSAKRVLVADSHGLGGSASQENLIDISYQKMEATYQRLNCLREMLRKGCQVSIHHLNWDRSKIFKTRYGLYRKTLYEEYLHPFTDFLSSGGGAGGAAIPITAGSEELLRHLRDFHDVRVEDLYQKFQTEGCREFAVEWNVRIVTNRSITCFTPKGAFSVPVDRDRPGDEDRLVVGVDDLSPLLREIERFQQVRRDRGDWDQLDGLAYDPDSQWNRDLQRPKYLNDYLKQGLVPPESQLKHLDRMSVRCAIDSGRLECLQWLIERMTPQQRREMTDSSDLDHACCRDDLSVIDYLYGLGHRPCYKAMRNAIDAGQERVAKHLVDLGAPLSLGETFRHFNCLVTVYQYLLERGETPASLATRLKGIHPIHLSEIIGDREKIDWLIDRGIERRDVYHELICRIDRFDLALHLLERPGLNYETAAEREAELPELYRSVLCSVEQKCRSPRDRSTRPLDRLVEQLSVLIERGVLERLKPRELECLDLGRMKALFERLISSLSDEQRQILLRVHQREFVAGGLFYRFYARSIAAPTGETFDFVDSLVRHRRLPELVVHLESVLGPDWSEALDEKLNNYIVLRDPTAASKNGFRVCRSLFRHCSKESAKEIFKKLSKGETPIVEDCGPDWLEQFYRHHQTEKSIVAPVGGPISVRDWLVRKGINKEGRLDPKKRTDLAAFEAKHGISLPEELRETVCLDGLVICSSYAEECGIADWILLQDRRFPKKCIVPLLIEHQGSCYWYAGWDMGDRECSVYQSSWPLEEQLGDDIVLVDLVAETLLAFVLSHE
jgi:hypothetical protein